MEKIMIQDGFCDRFEKTMEKCVKYRLSMREPTWVASQVFSLADMGMYSKAFSRRLAENGLVDNAHIFPLRHDEYGLSDVCMDINGFRSVKDLMLCYIRPEEYEEMEGVASTMHEAIAAANRIMELLRKTPRSELPALIGDPSMEGMELIVRAEMQARRPHMYFCRMMLRLKCIVYAKLLNAAIRCYGKN